MTAFRRSVFLAAVFGLAVAAVGCGRLVAPPPVPAAQTPRLLVLVVFDQMRPDYLDRAESLFVVDGLRRLRDHGADFINCRYPYATTTTGPGHASVLTGCSADRHGIVNNEWYDRNEAAAVYCATGVRFERVPPAAKETESENESADAKNATAEAATKKPKAFGAPVRLLAPTVADVLKEATGGKSRVFGLSLKDRSAVLPTGQKPDGAYWFESAGGQFVTSTYYRDRVHPWVEAFNMDRVADRWFGQTWDRLRNDVSYDRFVGPDDVEGEGKGVGKKNGVYQGRTFPHPMTGGLDKPGKNYYEALANSPFGNDLLLELVRRALVAEELGRRDVPDLLVVSFSSNDLVGHTWGPDSQEVFDTTLRSDRIMESLFKALDDNVGRDRYLLAVTADHGVCPLPEVSAKGPHPEAFRLAGARILADAEKALTAALGETGDDKTRWIENVQFPWIYLNERVLAARQKSEAEAAKVLAGFLAGQKGVMKAYTRAQLADELPDDPIGKSVQKSYFPDRSGSVYLVLAPYCLMGTGLIATGTTHGTPHDYDTHVPLLIFGDKVIRGRHEEAVTPQALATIFTAAVGLPKPAKAQEELPFGLLR